MYFVSYKIEGKSVGKYRLLISIESPCPIQNSLSRVRRAILLRIVFGSVWVHSQATHCIRHVPSQSTRHLCKSCTSVILRELIIAVGIVIVVVNNNSTFYYFYIMTITIRVPRIKLGSLLLLFYYNYY